MKQSHFETDHVKIKAKEAATKTLEIEIQQLNMEKKELESVIENQCDVIHHLEISNTKRKQISDKLNKELHETKAKFKMEKAAIFKNTKNK